MALAPLLKWAGGKRWQLPHLRPLWAAHTDCRLVEPFCGGLAVALGLEPARALLNDVNPHLINFYRRVQDGLSLTQPMGNDSVAYYTARTRFNRLVKAGWADVAETVGLFYYLNRTGFNGLCRFNKQGEFNVPFGRYTTVAYRQNFDDHRVAFQPWVFTCQDFEGLALQPDDVVYADPPYDSGFTAYSAGGFSWEDQERVARWLATHTGPVILVNRATDRIVALYTELGYTLTFLDGPRRISCTGDRTPVREVFATRNL